MSTLAQAKTITLKLIKPHPAQQQIITEARRFNIVSCGRRFGKTKMAIDRLVSPALSGFPVAYFTPTYRMLTEVWRETNQVLKPVTTRVSAQEHRIELLTGGVIEMWSLDNPDSARGRKYKLAVIDEAAMVKGLENAWQAVIRPTLTDYQGGAWMMSTPRGLNYFHDLFQRGQDPHYADWVSWQMPTTANPFIPPSEVEQARRDLPELIFLQEYLARFIQDAGAVFRNVDACLTSERTTPAQHRGHHVVMGVDWAQIGDFTALCVFCSTCVKELELDRFNQIAWSVQRDRLVTLANRWQARDILVEANSIGSPNLEALWEESYELKPEDGVQAQLPQQWVIEGLPLRAFQTTAASKPRIIRSLALCFEKEEARWLDDPVAKGELLAYEQKLSRFTGRATFSAPEGGHDDTVMARALAWEAAANTPIVSVV